MGCKKITYQNFSFLEIVHQKKATAKFIFGLNGDHLGNIRLSYSDSDGNGDIDAATEIIQEKNYYPFGLKHKGYNNVINGTENNFKTYQSQEFHEDLGLNLHEWKYRFSDPALGRFISIDPLAEEYRYNGVYNFAENRVIDGNELEGLEWQPVNVDGDNVAPNSDQIANYNWVGYDIKTSIGYKMKVNRLGNTLNLDSITPKAGTVASGGISTTNTDGVEGANFFSTTDYYMGEKQFSALQTLSASYTGTTLESNTLIRQASINNGSAKSLFTEGALSITGNYANGQTLQLGSWTARSGPWGNSSAPNGDYFITGLQNTTQSGMVLNGVGFKAIMTDHVALNRTLLRIHPDQSQNGSAGCIGLDCTADQLRNFRTIINNNFSNNRGNIPFNVNAHNNPDYSNTGTSTFNGGE